MPGKRALSGGGRAYVGFWFHCSPHPRIGQKHPVRVVFFGYAGSSQITCLQLMAKKIAVAQSTSGDVPESGLDSLNQDGDSVEMALARQLIAA